MVSYAIGVVCTVIGLNLTLTTRINLLTGQTSSPYMGVGIFLAAVGVVTIIVAQRIAKQSLKK